MLNSNIWLEILADLKKCKILIHPFAASCFLRTLSLKWSRKMMIELLAKNNNSDSVTNKKCPKLMSERGFSEIIFFRDAQLLEVWIHFWGCNSKSQRLPWLDFKTQWEIYKAVDHHHWHEDSLFACCSWWITEFPGCSEEELKRPLGC